MLVLILVASLLLLYSSDAEEKSLMSSLQDLTYNVNIDASKGLTVSGLSSGAYFAVQFHIAHSSIVNGSAIFVSFTFLHLLVIQKKK